MAVAAQEQKETAGDGAGVKMGTPTTRPCHRRRFRDSEFWVCFSIGGDPSRRRSAVPLQGSDGGGGRSQLLHPR
ncbi:hypothetical protein ACFX13_004119 [Malus domestica]